MSPNYFSTIFKQTLGISFSEYLARLRISKAISLIHDTDRTLVDIAADCGFNSMSNFYRAYQKYHGGNPSDIRK
jgi:Bacterial regulatory helix-turn-helix proteins, AraC family.